MGQIKNIIFDLGGVLLDLDFTKLTQSFKDIGFPHFELMYSQYKVDQLFEKLEKAVISEKEFYTIFLKIGKNEITADQVKDAWNSLLINFRNESLCHLKKLKQQSQLFLLSNTNSIHFEAFNAILKTQTGFNSLDSFFTKSYYSHFIKMRKPNKDIFDFVLKDAQINACETLFIDDTRDNIIAAEKLGLKTHLLLAGEKIETLNFSEYNSI